MPDERKTALVILGAGASYDVVPPSRDDASEFMTQVVKQFRPVLAKDIFTESPPVRDALIAHGNVDQISSSLRDLENGLEDSLRELSRSKMPLMQRGIKEMPLYLRHLFTSLSTFTKDPMNYRRLVHRLFNNSGFDQVTFVSLNYDRLLDCVLEHEDFGGPFDSMEAYDRPDHNPHFLYVKLHGSIDWAWGLPGFDASQVREIVATTTYGATVSAYLDLLHSVSELPADLGAPAMVDPRDHFQGDAPLYPALAIPTGEYEFICPEAHVEKLREFLPTCSNVLVIGCSARDQRFLEFLSSHLHIVLNFVLVDRGGLFTADLKERLLKHVPALGISEQHNLRTYDEGFSEFLRGGRLDEFIDSAR